MSFSRFPQEVRLILSHQTKTNKRAGYQTFSRLFCRKDRYHRYTKEKRDLCTLKVIMILELLPGIRGTINWTIETDQCDIQYFCSKVERTKNRFYFYRNGDFYSIFYLRYSSITLRST